MFKADDKVMHRTYGEVTVAAGPFLSLSTAFYAVNVPGRIGSPLLVAASTLKSVPPKPVYGAGDTVTFEGRRVRLLLDVRKGAGAFAGEGMAFVEYVDGPEAGRARSLLVAHLTPAQTIKVGDRVRVLVDDPNARTGEFVGKVGTVRRVNEGSTLRYNVRFDSREKTPYLSWNVASVELATEPTPARTTKDTMGRTYDLDGTYKDRDNDVWTFVDPANPGNNPMMKSPSMLSHRTLSYVRNNYGPLRAV